MTATPAAGYFNDGARTNQEAKDAQDDLLAILRESLGGSVQTELSIVTGSVTPTTGSHTIDTEADASTDDLNNILQTNHPDGRFLFISAANTARDVVVKHNAGGAGEIILSDGVDYTMDDVNLYLLLRRSGTTWVEVFKGQPKISELSDALIVTAAVYDFLRQNASSQWINQPVGPQAKSGTYTALVADHMRPILGTSTWTLSLTAAATLAAGWVLPFRNNGTGDITIDPDGSETIDGETTIVVPPGNNMWIFCDGTKFFTIGRGAVGLQVIGIPAGSLTTRTTDGAPAGISETTTNKVMIISKDFVTGSDTFVQFRYPTPPSWDLGDIFFIYGWSHPATTTNFDVDIAAQAFAIGNNEDQDQAFSSAVVTDDTGGTTGNLYISPLSAAVSPANTPAVGDELVVQIFRDVSGDAMAVDMLLQWVLLLYATKAGTDD